MPLTEDQVREALLLERELRARRRMREEAPKYDWYGPPCGCPETKVDEEGRQACHVHPRARANQRPPEHGGVFVNYPDGDPPADWENWLILAGRGFGKTRSGAEVIRDWAMNGPRNGRYALVGQQASDVRDIMIEGQSGILAISPPWFRPEYQPSKRRLTWPNGAQAFTYSSEEPGQFRGPQYHGAWCDESAKWSNADECYDNLQFGLRLGRSEGWTPRSVWTTTPLPISLIRMLLNDPKTVVSRGSTFENTLNLAPSALARFVRKYMGTRLGRQELDAEVLEDIPGALWKPAMIDDHRVQVAPDMIRMVVGVDPSGSAKKDMKQVATAHDEGKATETGIVVAGRGDEEPPHFYVFEDLSKAGSPNEWGRASVDGYHNHRCDCLAAETNFGGDMVEATIRNIDPDVAFKKLWASRGKVPRAEPIAALYEQGRVHHVGTFEKLESQMCSYVPGMKSPDRMDALVWALTELQDSAPGSWGAGVIPSAWRG